MTDPEKTKDESNRIPPLVGVEIKESNLPLEISMSKNTLLVNGRVLQASDGPEILRQCLTEGKDEILRGLERYRKYIQDLNPGAEVSLAPFSVMYFGAARERKKVLTKESLVAKEQVYQDISAIREEYKPFWEAVEASGYRPEVRVYFYAPSWDVRLWAQIKEERG